MADYSAQIAKARKAGYSDAEIVGFLSQKDAKVRTAMDAGYDPKAIIGKLSTVSAKPKANPVGEVTGFLTAVNRGTGIADELAGAGYAMRNVLTGKSKIDAGNLLASAGLAAIGKPDLAAESFKRSGAQEALRGGMAQQRALEDEYAAARPKTAALGRGTGNVLSMAVPGGQAGAALQGTRAANMLRGTVGAAAPAAAMGFVDRGNLQERTQAANASAAIGGLLGAGAGALARPVRTPKPVSKDVELLASEGVRMTPGQMSGSNVLRSAEDASTSLPMLGQEISERRMEGVGDFNKALVNRALKPIGDKLPDDIEAGSAAVKYAGDKLSAGYESAMPGKAIRADAGFSEDVARALDGTETLTQANKDRLLDILVKRIDDRVPENGTIDGRLYKQIQSELDFEVNRFAAAQDPDMRAMGDAISKVQGALEQAAKRQDPAFAKTIEGLDAGWAELARIEAAAAKSTDLSGVATPAQYRAALTSANNTVRKRGVARGEAMSQDLAGAALRVLPSKMPDSGTAGRSAWGLLASIPGAVIGGAAGGGPGAAAGLAATAGGLKLASRAYAPEAIEAANAALNARISGAERQQALEALKAMAANNPAAAELYRQVAARLGLGVTQNTLSTVR